MGGPRLTCSGSGSFTCNVCGSACARPVTAPTREAWHCDTCGASLRVRAMIAMLAEELLGVAMILPEFPVLKQIRGIGMSDSPELAKMLAEKFDYTNTFYHQAPFFDITNPREGDAGRYDFILSSEVMEHVPPPIEKSFEALARLLKPEGVLLLTTPYNVEGKTVEHFPELHEYTLASVGGNIVLVNRRRDGGVEVFENLNFHGGPGSTLEIRVFTEKSLRETIAAGGFPVVRMAGENFPEFGVEHAETWSLPIAARKVPRSVAAPAELARQYRDACRRAIKVHHDLLDQRADYQEYADHHERFHAQVTQDLESLHAELRSRTEWLRSIEKTFEERTEWGMNLAREKNEALAAFQNELKSAEEARACMRALERELDEARTARAKLAGKFWTRVGRKLGMVE
jgi:SAM-dependent methyltransferase